MRRVVVTGLGAVTPIGADVESTWHALLDGVSGAGTITKFDAQEFTYNYMSKHLQNASQRHGIIGHRTT